MATASLASSAFAGARRVSAPTGSQRARARTHVGGRVRAAATGAEATTAAPVIATVSIGDTFAALKAENKCAFIPFIVAGDPNLDATEKVSRQTLDHKTRCAEPRALVSDSCRHEP